MWLLGMWTGWGLEEGGRRWWWGPWIDWIEIEIEMDGVMM